MHLNGLKLFTTVCYDNSVVVRGGVCVLCQNVLSPNIYCTFTDFSRFTVEWLQLLMTTHSLIVDEKKDPKSISFGQPYACNRYGSFEHFSSSFNSVYKFFFSFNENSKCCSALQNTLNFRRKKKGLE